MNLFRTAVRLRGIDGFVLMENLCFFSKYVAQAIPKLTSGFDGGRK